MSVDAVGDIGGTVRAAQVTVEDEVPGEQVAVLVAECAVGDQEGQVLRGVARGVNSLDADVADGDLVTVVKAFAVESVLPVRPAFTGAVDFRAGGGREFAGARAAGGWDGGCGA